MPGNGWVTAQRRQPPPFSSRCAGDARTRPPSLSVESSDSCSDGQTRRSAERASAEVREGAMCVQRLDDSLNYAIRTTYRSSLRSSSKHEPRGPPLEFVFCFHNSSPVTQNLNRNGSAQQGCRARQSHRVARGDNNCGGRSTLPLLFDSRHCSKCTRRGVERTETFPLYDPSAGSPTETLLQLLLLLC